jgi:hypothetical protein
LFWLRFFIRIMGRTRGEIEKLGLEDYLTHKLISHQPY